MENTLEVWFGEMEFGKFTVGEFPHESENPIAIVHNIFEKKFINPERVEDYANGADYLIPAEFTGDIVFSRTFLKGLAR